MLTFKIRNSQELVIEGKYVVAAGTTDLEARFDVGDKFNGPLTAYFNVLGRSDDPYDMEIVDGKCLIPWEVLATSCADYLPESERLPAPINHIMFVSIADTERTTSSACRVAVYKSAFSDGTVPPETPSETISQQILKKVPTAGQLEDNTLMFGNEFNAELFGVDMSGLGGKTTKESIEEALGYTPAKPEEIPSKLSELTNDSGFITKTVVDLVNYYQKQETYNRDEINNLVAAIPKFSIEPVSSLPTSNISVTTVYLLKSGEETDNLYTEYIYVNGKWEYLGKQSVDLTGYAKTSDIPTKTSQLTNDSNFLTQHQDLGEYAKKATTLAGYGITDGATKKELNDLSDTKADQATLEEHINNNTIHVTATEKQTWNGVVNGVNTLTLGVHTDGKIYLFKNSQPVGTGVEVGVSGDVVGYIDENNNIVLSGNLAEGTYTVKYEMEDGTVVDVGTLDNTEKPSYTNLADPTSSDWQEGYRLSISSGSTAALAGHTTTNYIPCKMGDVLRVKGLKITGSIGGSTDLSDYAKIVVFTSNKAKSVGLYGQTRTNVDKSDYALKVTTDGDISTYTILMDNQDVQCATSACAYIRIDGCLMSGYTKNDVIITINEPIE